MTKEEKKEQAYYNKLLKQMNGLKNWWNKNAKKEYRLKMTAKEIKQEFLSELDDTGSIEMPARICKFNYPMIF